MATAVIMPKMGMTMEEGTVIQWFRQEGESVEKGQPLLEILTDKVNMEIEAPASGVLRGRHHASRSISPVVLALLHACIFS